MRGQALTPLGKEIKRRLVDRDRNGKWLVGEVRKKTGLYFDASYLSKVLRGVLTTPGILAAIREILDLPDSGAEGKPGEVPPGSSSILPQSLSHKQDFEQGA